MSNNEKMYEAIDMYYDGRTNFGEMIAQLCCIAEEHGEKIELVVEE